MKVTKKLTTELNRDVSSVLRSFSEEQIVSLIQQLNYDYYNTGKPLISDDIYDLIKEYLEDLHPGHPILSNVGSVIGDESKKVKLPYFMGSLDKVKTDNISIEKFKSKYQGEYIVSDKLDGVSSLVCIKDCTMKMYTRGDGKYGQDISHILSFLKNLPKISMINKFPHEFVVRGELICTKEDFKTLTSKDLANARNMVSGLVNAKVPDLKIASVVQFVSYEVLHPRMVPKEQMQFLSTMGFTCVYHKIFKEKDLNTESLSEILVTRRNESPFEVDGIVVMHNKDHHLPDDKNPQYAFAFKSLSVMTKAEVIVKSIEWNISKDGILVPTVLFDPVKLGGVQVSRSHGFHAKYIKENIIGPGSRLLIRRSGDVIPYIESVISESSNRTPYFPDIPFDWDKTETNIVVSNKNISENPELRLKTLQNFFSKLDVPGLGPANIQKIYNAGFITVKDILNITVANLKTIDTFKDKMAEKIYFALQAKKSVDCVTLMVASNTLGRGFGEVKIKKILDSFPSISTDRYIPSIEELIQLDGIQKTTAAQFIQNLPKYYEFLDQNNLLCGSEDKNEKHSRNTGIDFTNTNVVFTGFRSVALKNFIEEHNGIVKTGISKKVNLVIRKDGEESTKVEEARSLGVNIVNLSEFEAKYGIKAK